MKKIFIFLSIFISATAFSQNEKVSIKSATHFDASQTVSGRFDSLRMPAVVLKFSDTILSVASRHRLDSIAALKLNNSDSVLANRITANTNSIYGKVNVADTPTMLAPYVRKHDTTGLTFTNVKYPLAVVHTTGLPDSLTIISPAAYIDSITAITFAPLVSPLFTTPRLASTSTTNYVWTATDAFGNGSFQAAAGGTLTGSTGDIISFSGTNTQSNIADVATGSILVSAGTGTKPAYATAIPSGVTATTQSANDNSAKVGTTAYADAIAALKANLASPTFTGTPSLPTGTTATTQSANDNSTKLSTTAYADAIKGMERFTMLAEGSVITTIANTTYYFGAMDLATQPVTTVNGRIVIMPYACTLVGYSISVRANQISSTETQVVSIRINNTTDVLLSNVAFNATASVVNTYSSTSMSTSISAGDKWEIKWVTPATWATIPSNQNISVTLYFKLI